MSLVTLYDLPEVYDRAVPPGPCERFYRALAEGANGPVLELGCGTGRPKNARPCLTRAGLSAGTGRVRPQFNRLIRRSA